MPQMQAHGRHGKAAQETWRVTNTTSANFLKSFLLGKGLWNYAILSTVRERRRRKVCTQTKNNCSQVQIEYDSFSSVVHFLKKNFQVAIGAWISRSKMPQKEYRCVSIEKKNAGKCYSTNYRDNYLQNQKHAFFTHTTKT